MAVPLNRSFRLEPLQFPAYHAPFESEKAQMPSTIAAHFLPSLVTPEELSGGDVVMIDVLRASTTITYALAAGAKCVLPCREVDEARRLVHALKGEAVLLGGERGGLPIEGFDLGNSPSEFTPAAVRGKTIAFTTTNGTLALMQCRTAARVFIGAFVNMTAVVEQLTGERPIHLLCAGTRGRITREDVLFSGAVSERLLQTMVHESAINDQARIALDVWRSAVPSGFNGGEVFAAQLRSALRETQGGRNLIGIGLERDIDDAAGVDRFNVAPELDLATWRIVAR
jgi:2-phosphosulfolactate phosphatase